MRKFIVLALSLVLVGAGCLQGGMKGDVGVGTSPANGTPPPIELMADGVAVAGVEGSYCYGPMCVDKIGPIDLVAEANLDFKTTSRVMTFSSDAEVASMSVNVLNEKGNIFHETELTQDSSGTFTYNVPATLVRGDYYVTVFAQFEAGGDVSYVFPVHFE